VILSKNLIKPFRYKLKIIFLKIQKIGNEKIS